MNASPYCQPSSPVFRKVAITLIFSIPLFYFAQAQKNQRRDSVMTYYPQLKFILRAPEVLPQLAEQQQWTEMRNFLDNWNSSNLASKELIFPLESLLSIQTGRPASMKEYCDALLYLSDYSKELKNLSNNNGRFKYFVHVGDHLSYDATANARQVLLFICSWAKKLLKTAHLTSEEYFFCRVFSGVIDDPIAYYKSYPKDCPAIAAMQAIIDNANNKYFMAKRNGVAPVVSIMAGSWIPTGHLMILGAHPSAGFQLGVRNKLNEYDVTCNGRFLRPAGTYFVERNDSLLASNYYDGGYLGIEYTRYLVHRKYLDAGFTVGIGYDFIDINSGSKHDQQDSSYMPYTINAFNLSGGLRAKYFFRRKNSLGLAAKYNVLNYRNRGGSSLRGNAFSIDLYYGGH